MHHRLGFLMSKIFISDLLVVFFRQQTTTWTNMVLIFHTLRTSKCLICLRFLCQRNCFWIRKCRHHDAWFNYLSSLWKYACKKYIYFLTVRQRLSTTSTKTAWPLLYLFFLEESQQRSLTSQQRWPHQLDPYLNLDCWFLLWRFPSQRLLFLRVFVYLCLAKLRCHLRWGAICTTWMPQWL